MIDSPVMLEAFGVVLFNLVFGLAADEAGAFVLLVLVLLAAAAGVFELLELAAEGCDLGLVPGRLGGRAVGSGGGAGAGVGASFGAGVGTGGTAFWLAGACSPLVTKLGIMG